jgi:threonine dehydratase
MTEPVPGTAPGDFLYRLREEVDAADQRIRPFVRETPLERVPRWSERWGCEVCLKLENHQATGSFKLRGAVNKLLSLPMSQRALGVVAASTGNHGAAVAEAAARLGAPATVYVPEGTSPVKLEAIRALGAAITVHGTDGVEAELEARREAERTGRVYVSPYNDPQVIAGQGTIGAELVRHAERIDVLFVSVGGGGMIAGIAGYLRALHRPVTVIGCSPEHSPVMHESVRAGRLLEVPVRPTLSDGTAGGIEPEAITFPLCRALVDEWVLVSEAEIGDAMRSTLDEARHLVEGAAGVAIAAARRLAPRFPGGRVVIVVCGGNIASDTLKHVVCP